MPHRRILILSDGRPGHFNLSEGIAAALARLGPVDVSRIEVRRGRWSGAVLAALTRSRLPARSLVRRVYHLDEPRLPAADVIVSAGAETLAANVWLARCRQAPNIFYGSLRMFSPWDFSLVLTSYARNAARPRHALALKPSRLDPDGIAPPPDLSGRAPRTLALLLGGDAGGITWSETEWARIERLMHEMAATHGTRWLVSNSRRTPDAVSDRMARLAAASPAPILRFTDVRAASPQPLSGLLAEAEAVLCTDDSSSMVSECIWARRAVVGLRPKAFALPRDEADYRAWLASNGWSRSQAVEDLSPPRLLELLGAIEPMKANPQSELAALMAARCPELGPSSSN